MKGSLYQENTYAITYPRIRRFGVLGHFVALLDPGDGDSPSFTELGRGSTGTTEEHVNEVINKLQVLW